MNKVRTLSGSVILIALTAFITTAVVSTRAEPPATADPAEKGQMSEEQQKMMEAWMRVASPGAHHKHLMPMAGHWNMQTRTRMGPQANWDESAAVCEAEWVMGGRFLLQRVEGKGFNDMPFKGLGLMGYDNTKQKYVSVWVDDHSTMIFSQEGTCSEGGKVITMVGTYDDPMTGSKISGKSVYEIDGPNEYTLEMYKEVPGGGEFKTLEITHTRKK